MRTIFDVIAVDMASKPLLKITQSLRKLANQAYLSGVSLKDLGAGSAASFAKMSAASGSVQSANAAMRQAVLGAKQAAAETNRMATRGVAALEKGAVAQSAVVRKTAARVGLGGSGRQKDFETMAVGGLMTMTGGGIIGGLREAEKLAGQFAYQIAGLGAVSGATAQELKAMETSAKKAGIATQYTPTEAAQALQTLAQAGF
nr:hypothetical protein [Terriglobia bacterium]